MINTNRMMVRLGVATVTLTSPARASTVVAGPFGAQREESTSLGSGMVVDRRGYILTADHVVAGRSDHAQRSPPCHSRPTLVATKLPGAARVSACADPARVLVRR